MAVTYDFTIVSQTEIPGISQVIPQNEDAYNYLVDEAHFTVMQDGSACLFEELIGDFVSDAGWEKLACQIV